MIAIEHLTCSCGVGSLEVGVLVFGTWRIEKVLKPCLECGSVDVQAARERHALKSLV